eukprot:8886568-Pyramimonas_sp.AAC.1
MVNGSALDIFTKNLLKEMQIEMVVAVAGDITAAIEICSRLGVGRTKHLDARHLWLQEKVASNGAR